MKKLIRNCLLMMVCVSCSMILYSAKVSAEGAQLVTTVEALTEAMMNAQDGDTILVGDIVFKPMPMGMMQVPKNLVIKSGTDRNAIFTNATFALNGTASDAAPLKVRFECIDFVGNNAENGIDVENPPNVSSKMPDIMNTMCAGIFKMNLDVTYANCTFSGYHYGYGGVFNAIYSSDDNKNELNLTLEKCRFTSNAGNYGGVMYLIGLNHNITVLADNCIFENNAAATGGAVWAENANIDFNNCCFSKNQYIESDVEKAVGGAMALYNCGTELEDCVFYENESAEGGALFCEIAPFHTLVMRKCTLNGNKAAKGSAVSVVPCETNYSTEAKAYFYFSSFANHEGDAGIPANESITTFGCLFADKESPEETPSEENGYCLSLPAAQAAEKGYTANAAGHIFVNDAASVIPREAVSAVANGRFAEHAGRLSPGDFDESAIPTEPVQTVEETEESEETDDKTEKDDSSEGGEFTKASENHWVPAVIVGIVLFSCLTAGFVVWTMKFGKKNSQDSTAQQIASDGSDSSKDWIERVCEQPEIKKLLSGRELEVLPLLLEGLSREQIAKKLFISESTVKKHASSIYAKLNVSGKAELIAKMAGK